MDIRRYLRRSIRLKLNTGSTMIQGEIIKGGRKFDNEYRKIAAVCFMNMEDMKDLSVKEGENVKLRNDVGEVVLCAKEGNTQRGEVFVPRGPWINTIIPSETFGTGSPMYKGIGVEIEITDENVLSLEDILRIYKK